MNDEQLLRRAIALACESRSLGGDPFGAVLAEHGRLVAEARDGTIELSDPTAHAELRLISEYCRAHTRIALRELTLYSCVEPCSMCAGAIHWSRVGRVVFSVPQLQLQRLSGGNAKLTCADILRLGGSPAEVVGPLLEDEGLAALQGFQFNTKGQRHRARYAR